MDNQAAIQSAVDRKQGSGKYIVDEFHKQIDALMKRNRDVKITIRWSPGHEGIKGNEEADEVAKEAAAGTSNVGKTLPPFMRKALPLSKSALKQEFNKKLKSAAQEAWNRSSQAKRLKGIIGGADTKGYRKAIAKVDRRMGSLWTQLKTGHIGLRKHLKRIKVVDSDMCPACNQYTETVDHFLRHCRAYQSARDELRRKVKRDMIDLRKLIGNNKNILQVVAYAKKTERFPQWLKGGSHDISSAIRENGDGRSGQRGGSRAECAKRTQQGGGTRINREQQGGNGLLRWFKRLDKKGRAERARGGEGPAVGGLRVVEQEDVSTTGTGGEKGLREQGSSSERAGSQNHNEAPLARNQYHPS